MKDAALALTSEHARVAIVQTTTEAMVGVLGYAEGLAMLTAHFVAVEPRAEVRYALAQVIAGVWPWRPGVATFPEHLRWALQFESHRRIHAIAVAHGSTSPSTAVLTAAQVGDLGGVLAAAHVAASTLATLRVGDRAVERAALVLRDELHATLAAVCDERVAVPLDARDCAPLMEAVGSSDADITMPIILLPAFDPDRGRN